MDTERPFDQLPEFLANKNLGFEPESKILKSKTSLRMKYEAEAKVLLKGLGGLEGIRQNLGLSQRKMAQLLLVDPSAWSRWVKDESKVPPHVVKALQWYGLLEAKDPIWQQWRELIHKREMDPPFDRWRRGIESKLAQSERTAPILPEQWQNRMEDLRQDNLRLASELEKRMVLGLSWKLLLILNTCAVFYWVIKSLF